MNYTYFFSNFISFFKKADQLKVDMHCLAVERILNIQPLSSGPQSSYLAHILPCNKLTFSIKDNQGVIISN